MAEDNTHHQELDEAEITARALAYIKHESEKDFRLEVEKLIQEKKHQELRERFYRDLEFGTGGLRGIIGGGINRMNCYVVERATQGLAKYILHQLAASGSAPKRDPSAIIAYDSRRFSKKFAERCAAVFAANNITAFLFPSPRPTPMLSYAVRQLGAATGIAITASHNPPEYNGYKVYWKDGAQILPPHDKKIISLVQKCEKIQRLPLKRAMDEGMIQLLETKFDQKYIDLIKSHISQPELFKRHGAECHMVYTPLHGTGALIIEQLVEQLGMHCTMVPEQREPDGDFPTVAQPNPEEPAAFKMAVALAKKLKADLALATDPDSDRVGVVVRHQDKYEFLTGNQLGALFIDYQLRIRAKNHRLPAHPAVIKTVVTTNLQRKIAQALGATCYNTLTGFKHIARKVAELESNREREQFVLGGEESFGYIFGSDIREKDGIAAAIVAYEMTLHYKLEHKTLINRLEELYHRYGYYHEVTLSKKFPGEEGISIMQGLMEHLRAHPPLAFGDIAVEQIIDFLKQHITDCATNLVTAMDELPSSNVLQYILADGSVVSARPSGTEPKIKFYCSCVTEPNIPLDQAQLLTHSLADMIVSQIDTLVDEYSAKD